MKNLINSVICGDCLEVMRNWPKGCVDLVFGSPPYEDARDIPDKPFPIFKGQHWVDWMVSVHIDSLRICKGLVAFVIEGRTKKFRWSVTPALLMADLHRAGINLRKPPAFRRIGIPGSGGPDWLRNDYEFILCSTNGGRLPWSENTAMGHPPKWAPGGEMSHRISDGSRVNQWGSSEGNKSGPRNPDGSRGSYSGKPSHKILTKRGMRRANGERRQHGYTVPSKANPGNVIDCIVGGGVMGSKLASENEAPFPEKLAEFFIRSFCPPNGVVLDPFSGSGTTVAVAEKLNRRWIAIDIRKSQCDLTNRRINEAKQEPKELFI